MAPTHASAGIFEQELWSAAQGEGLRNSVRNSQTFGDHLSLVVLSIALLYRMFPDASPLTVMQAL